jgi:hypothetical protein
LAIDVRWFGGGGTPFALFGLFLLLAMTASVSWEILKSDISTSLKVAAIATGILLLTPADTVVMIGMPAMSVFLQTSAFALFSLVVLDGAREQGPLSNYRRAAAIIAACLAAFGVSGGLLIWPVLMWSAWRGGLGGIWVLSIACLGGLFIALYLSGLPSLPIPTSFNINSLVHSLDYAIRFLGLPWSHMPQLVWPARLIGIGIICVGGFLLINDSLATSEATRLQRIGLALVLYALLLAAAAALARVDVAPDREMPVRYGMFVVLAHVGLLLCLLGYLERLWYGAHRRLLQWATLAISVALLGQQLVVGGFAIREAGRYKEAWSRFVAGDWTPDMLQYVYPDRDRALAGLAYLRKMQIVHDE